MYLTKKIVSISYLLQARTEWKAQNKRIVLCQGCFDLLHRGHIQLLATAHEFGDVLIVAVNSDESVKELKGSSRPIVSAEDRAVLLAAIEYVDYITIFSLRDTRNLVVRLQPDIYIDDSNRNHKTLEAQVVSEYGGQLVTVQYLEGYSTTDLIQTIINAYCIQCVADDYHFHNL